MKLTTLRDSKVARDRTLGVFCNGVGSLLQFRRTKIGLVGLWPTDTQRLVERWPKEGSSSLCVVLSLEFGQRSVGEWRRWGVMAVAILLL